MKEKITKIFRWILIIWAWLGMINSAIRFFLLLTEAWPETSYELLVGSSVFILSLVILIKTKQLKFFGGQKNNNSSNKRNHKFMKQETGLSLGPIATFFLYWVGVSVIANILFAMLGLYALSELSGLIGFIAGIYYAQKKREQDTEKKSQ